MSAAPGSDQPKAAPRRSRLWKWTRRLLVALAVLLVTSVVALFAARVYFRSTGQRELSAETTKLDAEDPTWRFTDLMAAREKAAPPEAENSAPVVRRVRAMIPKEWTDWRKQATSSNAEKPPLNRYQLLPLLARDGDLARATQPARDLALTLRAYPRGYHLVVASDGPFIETLDETQGAREVAYLLLMDATVAAQSGDPVRGLRAAHAALNTGRSIGDEPTLMSAIVRFACGNIAAETAMRVLALKDLQKPVPELAALQVALIAEADELLMVPGFRGERAMIDRFFEGMDNGTVGPDAFARMAGSKPEPGNRASLYFYRTFLPEDRRRFLQLMTRLVDAAKAPVQERLPLMKQVEADVRANWDVRYPLHRLLLPAAVKVAEADLRHRAEALSAATLIACERFRFDRGHWPASLAELPKDLLATIPLDPYDGKEIKFAKLPDGIAVYTVGNGPDTDRDKKRLSNPLGGTEIGWRLYNPDQRGLPPLPQENADAP